MTVCCVAVIFFCCPFGVLKSFKLCRRNLMGFLFVQCGTLIKLHLLCTLLENSFHSNCNQFELGTLTAQKKPKTYTSNEIKC